MTRELVELAGDDPAVVLRALRNALDGTGPAILPQPDSRFAVADPAWTDPPPREVPVDTALVIETSGSSGRPKRVMLTTNALLASVAATESAVGGPGQWLLALPAHYIAGAQVLIRSITAGTDPVLLPPGHFDPLAFLEAADRLDHAQRYTSVVPTQLARLLDAADADPGAGRVLARFDAVLVGGQSLPSAVAERAAALGVRVRRTYGSSETSGGCVYDGVPLAGVRVREVEGEIELAGPMLAAGYLGDEQLTRERFHSDDGSRWYRTSDGGTFVDGVLRIYGRLDNVIISGGVKVSLDRVERAVHAVPGFEDAVVVGAPSERWGQEAVVVLTWSPAPDQERELRDSVAAEVGRVAAPKRVLSVEHLPLLSSGKPDRVALTRLVGARH